MTDPIEHAQEGIAEAGHVDVKHGGHRARWIAVLIATLAAILALMDMAQNQAQNEYLTLHISVSDNWAFYQAKNMRATVLAAEATILAHLPTVDQAAIDRARATEARMRDEPNGEGMKQLAEKNKLQEIERDHAFHRYHQFEAVVSALQIAIVLASISVVTSMLALAFTAGGVGLIAAGYGLLVYLGIVTL